MLNRVEFTNYRCFKGTPKPYSMDGLARVNLIVGKNNSGKTAALEGIHLLLSGWDSSVFSDIATRRGEVVFSGTNPSPLVEINHFFYGHEFTLDTPFLISGNKDNPSIEVKIKPTNSHKDENGEPIRSKIHSLLMVYWDSGEDELATAFSLTQDGLADDPAFGNAPGRFGIGRKNKHQPVRFVGTDSFDYGRLASLWDEVTLNGLESEVSKGLQLLEPDIQSIHMLTGMTTKGFFGSKAGAVLGLKSQKPRIPLGSMGEGMRRMLTLASSLACVPNGALLVDEIDTGLHYSVMTDMWKMVIKKAIASNIQVFATTHSWDCISGLASVCQAEPDLREQVAVHKMDRNIPRSIPFDGKSLIGMVPNDIDPR